MLADPRGAARVTFGLAEFIAAEEMDRHRGYWWSPDGSALLVARVDETPVNRWHIADPANPERPPAVVAYPAAGTPNAEVSLLLARLDGTTVDVDTGRAAFPYLVTACWEGEHDPLVVVQSRDQRTMRLLSVDAGTGRAEVLREDTDPRWLEIVPGVPAWTADGRLVWTADREDTRRLLVGAPGALAEAEPVTPPGLQVRGGDRRRRRHRAVPGVRRADRDRAVGLRSRRAEPGQRRRQASKRAPARAGPRSCPAAGSTTTA